MKLGTSLWLKQHLPLFIALGIALVFSVVHLIIEVERFKTGPLSKQGVLNLLDLKAIDMKFKSRPTTDLPPPKVTIAAIDEKAVQRYGLWPWSRSVTAEFIRKTTAAGVKVIGFDVIYADEDKNSSYVSIKRFVDSYEKAELHPDSQKAKDLTSAVKDAERRAKDSSDALNDTEKKLKGKAGPAKAPLAAARKAADDGARDLAKARERLADWMRESGQFYDTMTKEVASISPDDALANALAESPQTVMGFFTFLNKAEIVGVSEAQQAQGIKSLEPAAIRSIYERLTQDVGGNEVTIYQPAPDAPVEKLAIHQIVALAAPLPKLAARAKGFGFFNAHLDQDGPVRSVWMVHRFKDTLYPSLSLSVVAKYYESQIWPLKGQITSGTLDSIAVGNVEIPTDMRGRLLLNYYDAPEKYFPAYSIADFIDGTVPADAVKDKVVLVGMTAQGLYDMRPNPFSAATPGVYVHAVAVQNILDDQFLERPFGLAAIEILFYLLLGLILGLALPRMPAWSGLIATFMFAVALYWFDVFFVFSHGTWMLTVLPTVQVALTYVGVSLHGYLTEGREKRKIRNAFQFYLTRSVVDEVLKDPSKLKLGGERRICTVLFSDIRGFTTISERLEPVQLIDFLNEYFTPMTNLLFKYDGTLDKYMGDAIMAIFGAPVAFTNHATRACYTALEMMDELHRLQVGWRAKQLPEIDIGVGLNTGPMAVGNMGSHVRFSYTVMGDSVNLASRLEGINKQYGTNIIISEFTYAAAKDDIIAREMDSVRVKGKREPVQIFELLGKGKPSEQQQGLITTFESAIALYKGQKWDEAIAAFDKVRTTFKPNDFASTMYIERCEHMRADPPGATWDGVYTMKTK